MVYKINLASPSFPHDVPNPELVPNHFPIYSSGKSDPSLVLGVVEKHDSVAWMLHMPDSPKTIKKWKKHNW